VTRPRVAAFAGVLALSFVGAAVAQPSPGGPALSHPEAFERAFATSSYTFDACGDPLAGRLFRRALAERFAHCPFTIEAQSRFQQRTRIQQEKARRMIAEMVEAHGGLPMHLDGMAMTCHEQQASADYRRLRERLDQYAQGDLSAEAVIGAPCDAPEITP
jgi:hypothetical protein